MRGPLAAAVALLAALGLAFAGCDGGGGPTPLATVPPELRAGVSPEDLGDMLGIIELWDRDGTTFDDLTPFISTRVSDNGLIAVESLFERSAEFGGPVFGIDAIGSPERRGDGTVEISFSITSVADFLATVAFVEEGGEWRIARYCETEASTTTCWE